MKITSNVPVESQTNIALKFSKEVLTIFNTGILEALPEVLQEMYKNIFLYAAVEYDDYNTLSFEERAAINELYELLSTVMTIALKYDYTIWAEERVMLAKCDADMIETMYDSLDYDKEVYLKLIDKLTVTTILYKPIKLAIVPTMETASFYYNCNALRRIFAGYKHSVKKAKRLLVA